jgi:hypothetical protein
MTWGEFKKLAEKAGITDDMEIFYIDTGNYPEEKYISFYPADEKEGISIG